MYKNTTIRFISALGLSLLFLLSNTPKKLVHAIFASHVDQKKNLPVTYEGECLLQLSYHCQCDNLVVESPFTTSVHSFSVFVPRHYQVFTSSQYCSIPVDADRFSFSLRGPPYAV